MITNLHLINFRNHTNYKANIDSPIVVVFGENGAGKTNLLEAISLFAPGRSMRSCKLDEIITNTQSLQQEWAAHISYNDILFSTGYKKNGLRRIIKNQDILKCQSDILHDLKVVWMLPQMESIFSSSSSARRKFLDRICFNLYSEHAKNIIKYEYYLKSRLKVLLQYKSNDNDWLDSIEFSLAELAILIHHHRKETVNILKQEISLTNSIFLKPSLELKLVCLQEEYNLPFFLSSFKNSRKLDSKTAKSHFGVHKEDLIITHALKKQSAALCSTGEQKALLVAVLIAQARAIKRTSSVAPLMLMDEALSHFDNIKQHDIIEELTTLSSQIWVTTTKQKQELQNLFKKHQPSWLHLA